MPQQTTAPTPAAPRALAAPRRPHAGEPLWWRRTANAAADLVAGVRALLFWAAALLAAVPFLLWPPSLRWWAVWARCTVLHLARSDRRARTRLLAAGPVQGPDRLDGHRAAAHLLLRLPLALLALAAVLCLAVGVLALAWVALASPAAADLTGWGSACAGALAGLALIMLGSHLASVLTALDLRLLADAGPERP
ncbi:hypothetical protein [Allonocardiopsis opalescens]|uniref:Uncharacterized protein n=1 Tax=Allonocardiopsis opalescens TaxID=1144618 RepID=A0A2T0QF74_9ACTN|nr:hypothetical protein [Allonocardiopsis opalescens]PRY02579.1 hypothetical protein CLV72_1011182 [Allonocardiopsis opalescens]